MTRGFHATRMLLSSRPVIQLKICAGLRSRRPLYRFGTAAAASGSLSYMSDFASFGLAAPILSALVRAEYTTPTPIQSQAIPHVMRGADLLGIAQTGTGKTAAFALPIIHRLMADRRPYQRTACRCLVLAPTRELASQIAESFRTYGRQTGLRVAVIFGGVPKGRQIQAVQQGVDVVVATPGRLLDLFGERHIRLDQTEILVLDEADHMLDLGFVIPIRRIAKELPAQRQNLFFSATMPKEIASLAGALLKNPVQVSVAPVATTAERVEQCVMFVPQSEKRTVLARVLRQQGMVRTLVFARTKHGADRIVQHLTATGLNANAIHGNKSQGQRERALSAFKTGQVPVLVATDIAARGIDVDGVTHVINYDLPDVPEAYVHRIGRTARAGAAGSAISLCDETERGQLKGIERLIRLKLPVAA
jgi:ATP-dependent RNA helicase RhlE